MKSGLLPKVGFVSLIVLLLGLGLAQIQYLVAERMQRRDGVVTEIAASTANSQTLTGPLLVVPYTRIVQVRTQDSKDGKPVMEERKEEAKLYLTPAQLDARGDIGTERLRRGLHHAFVFNSHAVLSGKFVAAGALITPGLNERIIIGTPRLIIGISDPRGLMNVPVLRWNDENVEVLPGTAEPHLAKGIHASMPHVDATRPWSATFSLALDLRGTQSFDIVPAGDATHIVLSGQWPHPSFYGAFLPEKREVRDDGFTASWATTHLATDIQNRLDLSLRREGAPEPGIGVRFVDPGDQYAQTDRSIKYGLLFIGLTFAAFFLFEVLKRLAIHPLQYGLTGAALVLFYLLLLALSEHMPFGLAYLIGAGACVALLTHYLTWVLRSFARSLSFGALLTCVFGVLYVLISLEDHALLAGAVSLFGALALVMILTRRVDWYRLSAPAATEVGATPS